MYTRAHGAWSASVRDEADDADARRRCGAVVAAYESLVRALPDQRLLRQRAVAGRQSRAARLRALRRATPIARPRPRLLHAAHARNTRRARCVSARERGARRRSTPRPRRRRPCPRPRQRLFPRRAPAAAVAGPRPLRRRPRRSRRPRRQRSTPAANGDGRAEGASTGRRCRRRSGSRSSSTREVAYHQERDRQPAPRVLRPQGRQGRCASAPGRHAQVRRRRREGSPAGAASAEHHAPRRRPRRRRRATASSRSTSPYRLVIDFQRAPVRRSRRRRRAASGRRRRRCAGAAAGRRRRPGAVAVDLRAGRSSADPRPVRRRTPKLPLPSRTGGAPESLPPAGARRRTRTASSRSSRQLGLGVSRIVIDAGHGGHDPGAHGNGINESELTLDVALRAAEAAARSSRASKS